MGIFCRLKPRFQRRNADFSLVLTGEHNGEDSRLSAAEVGNLTQIEHYSRVRLSMIRVTGPALTSPTSIIAPNRPVAAGRPMAFPIKVTKRS